MSSGELSREWMRGPQWASPDARRTWEPVLVAAKDVEIAAGKQALLNADRGRTLRSHLGSWWANRGGFAVRLPYTG